MKNNFKKAIAMFLVIVNVLIFAGCGNGKSDKKDKENNSSGSTVSMIEMDDYKVKPATKYTKFKHDERIPVICWGDSITEGMSMEPGKQYPEQLGSDLKGQYRVYNAGVGGERSFSIITRANAVDFFLANDLVFPVGVNSAGIGRSCFVDDEGTGIWYNAPLSELKANKIIMDGNKYSFAADGTITREDASAPLTVPKGTKVTFDYSDKFDSIYCNVILVGCNDGKLSGERLVQQYNKIAKLSDKNIYIAPFYYEEVPQEMKDAFGNQLIDLNTYIENDFEKDYGVKLKKRDYNYFKNKKTPPSFCYQNKGGDVHLNSLGYKVLADLVYKKGVELGYWK